MFSDSEQDYKLQRLVKVLNENYQTGGREVESELDTSSNQKETTDSNYVSHVVDYVNTTEVLYRRSQQQNIGHNLSSTSSLQNESSSTVVKRSLTPSETNTMPGSELGENADTSTYTMDPLRTMLKVLQQNPNKAKQDISNHAHLTVLDFAGQYAFYTTHQMFLTRRAIYLLVSDASKEVSDLVEDDCYLDSQGIVKCRVHELVQVWMNSIHSCALPDKENLNAAYSHMLSYKVIPPPVILVGTHIDQIPQNHPGVVGKIVRHIHKFVSPVLAQRLYCRKHGQRYLEEIRSYLRDKPTAVHLVDEDFAIDNSFSDSKLEELKKKIVEVASQQPYWGEQIPTRWFLLEQQLMRLRDAGVKVVSHSTVEHLNKEGAVCIEESEELDLFLRYLHETGIVIYFSIEVLRDNIILDPKWMIDALKLLINAQPNLPVNTANNNTESSSPAASAAHSGITQKWSDFKEKGILTVKLVDAIWTKEKHPDLHEHKDHILMIMEQLNILARPRSFNEMGEKVEDYFLTPCMLRQESPKAVISPAEDPHMAAVQPWHADEGHDDDPDAPITREHMNHARLCVAIVTVCGNAMRDVLSTQVPSPHTAIHQAILANKGKLTSRQGRKPLLNYDQTQLVYPDPQGKTTGKVDQFDLSLLYTLIRNISTVPSPVTGWGNDPHDQPRDNSLGASVERIRSYRNQIGHSMDRKMSQQDFDDYWNKIDAVLDDIEIKLGRQGFRAELEKQKKQVITIYEAC
ncbi:hypothetical protein ACJMK2_002077 [Sinanodonta woodiana]|uniref:C-terminal of Roc (COR) domain-containing protein n=1 Tax=Sinanodonta woodiana TaxID=1069815 RepID=A0ABD3XXM9_SINWO